MHNDKTYEICLPNLVWKKYTLSSYMRIAELLSHLGNEHGFDGGSYDLVHRGTILDKSCQLQHYVSSIPNNGRIELLPVNQTQGTPNSAQNLVKVAIDIDATEELSLGGGRLIKNVPSSITLLQCLLQSNDKPDPLEEHISQVMSDKLNYVQDDINWHPQILYVRHVLTGLSELSSTTLQQLGIHSGSARIKFRFVKGPAITNLDNFSKNTAIVNDQDKTLNKINVEESLPKKQKMSSMDNLSVNVNARDSFIPTPPTPNPSSPPVQSITNITQPSTLKIHTENLELPKDRGAMFFRVVEKQPNDSEPPAPLEDSFFEVTLEDVRAMQSDLTRKRVALENAPFKTSAMLEAENMVKLTRYPRTLVRIELPWWRPRVALQALFLTTETLGALYAFVRHALGAPAATTPDFKLFTAPPKRVLVDSETVTFFDAQLYPSAKIYLSSSCSAPPPYVEAQQFVSQTEADYALTNFFNDVALKTLSL